MIFWIVVILGLITAAQLMRVALLSKNIRKKREEEISDADNNLNAGLIALFGLLFFGSMIYMMITYGMGLLPEAASVHGEKIDNLFKINFAIILAVFFLTNALLIFFAIKYRGKKGNKAYYFPHDNRLEMIWTIVPSSALAVIIILGLRTWNDITSKPSDNAKVVEVFGEQFKWTVRYAGDDNKLGYADYKLINGTNPLGVVTPQSLDATLTEMDETIEKLGAKLESDSLGNNVLSKANFYETQAKKEKYIRLKARVQQMKEHYTNEQLVVADDDFMTNMELHLVKGQEYQFVFRSKDVMHSAYFPHFRAQMNVVPGMRTKFKFTPKFSTAEMRTKVDNPEFNYALLCNKICGEGHSNMKMIIVVDESKEEFTTWKAENTKTPIAQN